MIWFYVRVCAVCERTNEFTIIWIANFKTSLSQCEKKGSHDFKWLLLLLEICWTCKFFILTFLNRIRLETIALQINFQYRHNKFYCSRLSWLHFYSFFFLCSFECFCLCTISSDSFKNRLYVHFTQTNLSIAIYKFEQFDNGKHHQSKKNDRIPFEFHSNNRINCCKRYLAWCLHAFRCNGRATESLEPQVENRIKCEIR